MFIFSFDIHVLGISTHAFSPSTGRGIESEGQRVRGSEGHRGTGAQGYRDTGAQWHRGGGPDDTGLDH